MAQTETACMAPPLTNGVCSAQTLKQQQKTKKQTQTTTRQIVKYVRDVNDHLTCYICKGYYIDATTIVECLHSFCRSCIIKRLQFKSYCPVCEIMINKAKPNIKPDKILQDIVYKLVPGLHRDEMRRRREFYNNHMTSAVTSSLILDDGITSEQRGEDNERLIYNSTDLVSLSLEYYNEPESDIYSTVNNNVGKGEVVKEEKTNEKPPTRYLQCPAGLTIRLLKKFLIQKYDIDVKQFHVDILYKRVPLPDDYKLLDIAYIYSWKRVEPMRIFYRVTEIKYAINRFDFFNPCPIEETTPTIKPEPEAIPAPPPPIKQEEKSPIKPPPPVKQEEKSPIKPPPPPKPEKSPPTSIKKVTFESPLPTKTKKIESPPSPKKLTTPTSPKQKHYRKSPCPKQNPFIPPKSPKKQKLSAVVSSSEQVSESEKQKRIFLNTFQLTSTQNVPRPPTPRPPVRPPPPPPPMEEVSSTSQIRTKRKYTFKTRPMSKKSKMAAEAEKTQSLKTIFDNCKLTIPSSLSITLSGQSETPTPTDANLPMFFEIFKIPNQKKELSPPPLANISKNRDVAKVGNFKVQGLQSLGMLRLTEPQKPQTGFQKMFEEAIKRKEIPAPSTPGIKIPSAKKIKLEPIDLSSATTPPRLSLLPTKPPKTTTPPLPNLLQTTNVLQQPKKQILIPKHTGLLQPAKKNTQSNQITSTGAKTTQPPAKITQPPAKITPLAKITQSSNGGALSPTEIQNQYNLTNLAQLQQVMLLRKQLEYRRTSLNKLLHAPPLQKPPPGSPRPSASDRSDTNAAALMHFEKYMKSLQQPSKLTIPKSPVPKNLPSPKQVAKQLQVTKTMSSPKGSPTSTISKNLSPTTISKNLSPSTSISKNLPSPLGLSPKGLGSPVIVPKSLPSPTTVAKSLLKK